MLFNLVEATYVLLGAILGVQILIEGITLLLLGLVPAKTAPMRSTAARMTTS